jgi:hypothetical protein
MRTPDITARARHAELGPGHGQSAGSIGTVVDLAKYAGIDVEGGAGDHDRH